jgi:hypothetical protein
VADPRPPPSDSSPRTRTEFLDRIEQEYGPLRKNATLAEWRFLMGRTAQGSLPWQLRLNRMFSMDGLLPWVRTGRRSATDPVEFRRFELLERLVTEAVIEQHRTVAIPREGLERSVVGFRPRWKGRRVNRATVQEAVRTSSDRTERRAAWYAQDGFLRSIEGPLRKLAHLRNDRARELGFRSYPDYRLRFEGLSVTRLIELLDETGRNLRSAARWKRDRFEAVTGLRDWFPWDANFADEVETPIPERAFGPTPMVPSVLAGVRKWGFGKKALTFPIDRHDLPSGGIEIPIDPPGDVRVIVHPAAGWVRYMILFHEVGHTVQARSNDRHSPFVRWHEYMVGFPGFIEGIGTLFEEIPRSPEWLATRPGVDRTSAKRFAETRNLSDLLAMAWRITHVRVELELYRNPDGDLEGTQYRWLRRLNEFDAFDPPSFADPFLVRNPMYLQSYVFASLFAKQLLETMRAELGESVWPNPRFGPWLTEHWFRRSGEFDWVPHLKTETGRPFGPEAYSRAAERTIAAVQSR